MSAFEVGRGPSASLGTTGRMRSLNFNPDDGRSRFDVANEGVDIARNQCVQAAKGVEIAVGADVTAEGNVQVDAEGSIVRKRSHWVSVSRVSIRPVAAGSRPGRHG